MLSVHLMLCADCKSTHLYQVPESSLQNHLSRIIVEPSDHVPPQIRQVLGQITVLSRGFAPYAMLLPQATTESVIAPATQQHGAQNLLISAQSQTQYILHRGRRWLLLAASLCFGP